MTHPMDARTISELGSVRLQPNHDILPLCGAFLAIRADGVVAGSLPGCEGRVAAVLVAPTDFDMPSTPARGATSCSFAGVIGELDIGFERLMLRLDGARPRSR